MPADISTVINDLEDALELAFRDWDTNYKVSKVELSLQTQAIKTVDGTIKLEIPYLGEITIGPSGQSIDTHTLSLELSPLVMNRKNYSPAKMKDIIKDAVATIRQAIDELKSGSRFELKKAVITLTFVIEAGGKITILGIGISGKKNLTHSLAVHIEYPSPSS